MKILFILLFSFFTISAESLETAIKVNYNSVSKNKIKISKPSDDLLVMIEFNQKATMSKAQLDKAKILQILKQE